MELPYITSNKLTNIKLKHVLSSDVLTYLTYFYQDYNRFLFSRGKDSVCLSISVVNWHTCNVSL